MNLEEQIEELQAEVDYLKKIIDSYEARESDLASAEDDANKAKAEIISAAKRQFDMEADRLRLFKMNWDKAFPTISSSILDVERRDKIDKLNALACAIDDIFVGGSANYSQKIASARQLVDDYGNLIKGSGIRIGEGDDSFDLSEATAPSKSLDLEALCREMGLMED